ncbi:MAG: hypothetical protein HRF43_11310 [Phycisphaerae bacterium]|jgi:hypothetical protein
MQKAAGPLLVIMLIAVAVGIGYHLWPRHPHDTISYPYICRDCGAVFDVKELKKNWRTVPGESDSVAYCIRCGKGRSYPVSDKCEQCGTRRILHITRDPRCPVCFPEAAEVAKKAGIDVIYRGR